MLVYTCHSTCSCKKNTNHGAVVKIHKNKESEGCKESKKSNDLPDGYTKDFLVSVISDMKLGQAMIGNFLERWFSCHTNR